MKNDWIFLKDVVGFVGTGSSLLDLLRSDIYWNCRKEGQTSSGILSLIFESIVLVVTLFGQ